MAIGTLDSEWTKIMDVDRLCIWATSINDRNIGMRNIILCWNIILCLTLLTTTLLLPLFIFIMLLLRCLIEILKGISHIGLCLKTTLLPVMSLLCCLSSNVMMTCLFCFSSLNNP